MWQRLGLLGLCLLFLPGCFLIDYVTRPVVPLETAEPEEPVLVPEYNGVIFPARDHVIVSAGPGDISGYWMPTVDDVRAMESRLPGYLESLGEEPFWGERVWEKLDTYHRQYEGFFIDGRAVLHTFFFCNVWEGMDWQHERFMVDDGGACYFEVNYDLDTGEFFDLFVNGIA
jgi:hypothetical protein